MLKVLELYLIAAPRNRYLLFSSSDAIEECEALSGDRVKQFVSWLTKRPNRIAKWVGRALDGAYAYYIRLEDRIDPVERVLKAVALSETLTVYYSDLVPEESIRTKFQSLLRRQHAKQVFWLVADSAVTAVVIVLTPFLAPLPGPNVFFYYPAMRLMSHYRARRGAAAALALGAIEFKCLPELRRLEENLQTPRFDRSVIRTFTDSLQIRGLDRFLERMV